MRQYKFQGIITIPDEYDEPDEEFMDLKAFYYGDKHQEFTLQVVAGTIEEFTK